MRGRSSYAEDYEKFSKKGRGRGNMEGYVPYISIRDAKPHSVRTRVFLRKINREFTVLSNGEYQTLLILDWNDDVYDIKEQYPLDPASTIPLAEELGIRHPSIHNKPIVMTSDFVVYYRRPNGIKEVKVFQIKYDRKDTESQRVRQKLKLERIWWERRNVSWNLLYSSEYNQIFCENLNFIRRQRCTDCSEAELNFYQSVFSKIMANSKPKLLTDKECNVHLPQMPNGKILTFGEVVKILIGHKKAEFDIKHVPLLSCRLQNIRLKV